MHQFDHEKLDVYRASVRVYAVAHQVVESLPRGHGKLADQLTRAALSVPANIAEGAGEFSRDAKASFYRIACRSATECAALLDAGTAIGVVSAELHAEGRGLLLRIVSMLTKLAKRHNTL